MTNCSISGNDSYSGFGVITIRGGTISNCTIVDNSGANSGSILGTGGNVTITNCTISDNTGFDTGAIGNSGTLTISNSTISNNFSGLSVGGISNSGTLTISNSTISGNEGQSVGGILNNGTLIVSNSTISGNVVYVPHAQSFGGIANLAPSSTNATVTLLNCTLADNTGTQLYSGLGLVQLRNVIIAGDGTAPNLSASVGDPFISLGHNLSSDNGSGFLTGPGDLLNVNPLLGPLQDNGGPTETMALLPGSPAVDAGDPTQLGTPDQRGVVRSGGVNIGAYQASASGLLLTYTGTVVSGVAFDVTVTAVDRFSERAVGYRGTISFSTSDTSSGVVLPAAYTFTGNDAGLHTFRAGVILVTPGSTMLSVSDTSGLTGGTTVFVSAPGLPPGGGGADGGTRTVGLANDTAVNNSAITHIGRTETLLGSVCQPLQRRAVEILFGQQHRWEPESANTPSWFRDKEVSTIGDEWLSNGIADPFGRGT
jgi:hypothetical protein